MSIQASGGVKVYIGGNTPCDDASEYAALTWTEIDDIETIGDFGDTAERITFNSLSDGRVRKLKGVRDAGTLEITMARNIADAGQLAAAQAALSNAPFNMKIELNDKPLTGTSPKNSVYYFAGPVDVSNQIGGVNDVTKLKMTVDISTEILLVPASGS